MQAKYPTGLASIEWWSPTRILVTAFLIGSLLIVSLRLLIGGLGGATIAAFLAAFIIILVGAYYHKEHRSTEDRQMAGDNLYYLGLLFTLVSLIFALLKLFVLDIEAEVDERANELIGNFGVALISTVAGILARIFFQNPINSTANENGRSKSQSSDDIPKPGLNYTGADMFDQVLESDDIPKPGLNYTYEAEAVRLREELARLRLVLRQAEDAFVHFFRISSEHARDSFSHTGYSIRKQSEDFKEDFKKFTENQIEQTTANLKSITETFQTEMKTLSENFTDVVSEFNRHMTAEASQGIAVTSKVWSDTSARLKSDSENQIKAIYGDINGLLAGAEKSWGQLSELSQMIAGSMDGMRTNIETIQSMIESSASASLETNNLVRAMKSAQAELDLAGSTVAGSIAAVAEGAREISGLQNTLTINMNQARLEATEEYRKVTAGISSQINQRLESDCSKLKKTLANAVTDIDSHYKTGSETLEQAQQLMTREAEEWKNLAEHTRKSLARDAEHLASLARKT